MYWNWFDLTDSQKNELRDSLPTLMDIDKTQEATAFKKAKRKLYAAIEILKDAYEAIADSIGMQEGQRKFSIVKGAREISESQLSGYDCVEYVDRVIFRISDEDDVLDSWEPVMRIIDETLLSTLSAVHANDLSIHWSKAEREPDRALVRDGGFYSARYSEDGEEMASGDDYIYMSVPIHVTAAKFPKNTGNQWRVEKIWNLKRKYLP